MIRLATHQYNHVTILSNWQARLSPGVTGADDNTRLNDLINRYDVLKTFILDSTVSRNENLNNSLPMPNCLAQKETWVLRRMEVVSLVQDGGCIFCTGCGLCLLYRMEVVPLVHDGDALKPPELFLDLVKGDTAFLSWKIHDDENLIRKFQINIVSSSKNSKSIFNGDVDRKKRQYTITDLVMFSTYRVSIKSVGNTESSIFSQEITFDKLWPGIFDIEDRCKLKLDVGPCRNRILHYFYNTTSEKCESFMYGGCGGNDNRFISESQCKDICCKYSSDIINDIEFIKGICPTIATNTTGVSCKTTCQYDMDCQDLQKCCNLRGRSVWNNILIDHNSKKNKDLRGRSVWNNILIDHNSKKK
ncbi:LOW QUALITY PROTEIN: hypothetical protein KUTeg_021733 [Tegillarca granosa]|uniref:Uncharacterized protein n=1 Tax=Tegillarca granosa TaxID=220873 RepID=A0ABQ9E475_TEGGR|nr:LOW QUALITY PROTEIN: hypothetical protein KUTeg_021733 [Tegillarca granosa]